MKKQILALSAVALGSSLLIWLVYFFNLSFLLPDKNYHMGILRIIENFDGPNYLIIAKTLYNSSLVTQFETMPHDTYFPAHLPLFPLLIKFFHIFTSGYLSGLMATAVSQIFLVFFIFKLARQSFSKQTTFWITLAGLFLPFRFWTVRSVISPEPLFIGAIIASIYFFKKEKHLPAGIFGVIAQTTKSPGIFLFFAYAIYMIISRKKLKADHLWLMLIPLSGIAVFAFYYLQTGNFWAYFSSPDMPIYLIPFVSMLKNGMWLNEFWLEDILWLWLIEIAGILLLFKKNLRIEGLFALIFFIPTLFLLHRDITRYSLPMWPLIMIGFGDLWKEKIMKKAFLIMLIPAFFYTLKFIFFNYQPINNWSPFL